MHLDPSVLVLQADPSPETEALEMTELKDVGLRDTGDRYEIVEDGQVVYADYRRQGERLYIDYVFSPVALRGTGASGRLMAAVAAKARGEGLSITPICGYAAAWLRRSHEFRDLVA
jgi:predicted GNAT family acetyltransferase